MAQYRKAFANSGAKNDPSDALIQAEILMLHRKQLSAIKPDSTSIRALAQLTEYRRKLVQDCFRWPRSLLRERLAKNVVKQEHLSPDQITVLAHR